MKIDILSERRVNELVRDGVKRGTIRMVEKMLKFECIIKRLEEDLDIVLKEMEKPKSLVDILKRQEAEEKKLERMKMEQERDRIMCKGEDEYE